MSEPATGQMTILVVDDELGPRESLRMVLAPRHHVVLAENGAEALEILRTTPVDIVTVDLNMPGMRGDELMRTVRDEFPQIEVIVITGYGTMESAVQGLRHGICDYLSKPFDVVQVIAAVTRAQARQQSRRNLVGFLEGIGEVLGRDRDATDLLEELEGSGGLRDRVREMLSEPALEGALPRTAAHDPRTVDFLEILADTIESRDLFMRGHARRVAFYAGLLADRLCLSAEVREHLRISSFLHDLGKVGVPSEVLSSRDPLGRPERDAVEQHTAIGERLIRPLGFGSAIASVIRHHHEHFDGTGYPDGVRGEEIPLVARIVSVADAFDAMTCDRPYRQAMSQEAAVVELRKFAGAQFDPNLVKEFVAIVETGICDINPDLLDLRNLQESPSSESAAPSAPQQGGKR